MCKYIYIYIYISAGPWAFGRAGDLSLFHSTPTLFFLPYPSLFPVVVIFPLPCGP